MPPTILYICGGMIIAVIASYALFDLSRPTHMSQAEREAKRMAKEKKKYKRYTDAVVEYATQKDAEAKAFRDKHSEPLTYFHPPEDNAEPACNETDIPMQADPDVKPDMEENQTADVEPIVEEIPEAIPSEELEANLVLNDEPENAPTSEISDTEPEDSDQEISNTEDTFESEETIENPPQDNMELSEEDDLPSNSENEDSASSVPAELAQDPTGLDSEAESNNEEPQENDAETEEYDFATAEQNPYVGPESQPKVWPENDSSEIYQKQDDNFPNEFPSEDQSADEIISEDTDEDPEIQNTPEGEVQDFEPGTEPGLNNIVQMPQDLYQDIPEDMPEDDQEPLDNITQLYTEHDHQVPDGWEDYPDTEIIPEDTTDKEIPTTDSSIPSAPENEKTDEPTEKP